MYYVHIILCGISIGLLEYYICLYPAIILFLSLFLSACRSTSWTLLCTAGLISLTYVLWAVINPSKMPYIIVWKSCLNPEKLLLNSRQRAGTRLRNNLVMDDCDPPLGRLWFVDSWMDRAKLRTENWERGQERTKEEDLVFRELLQLFICPQAQCSSGE